MGNSKESTLDVCIKPALVKANEDILKWLFIMSILGFQEKPKDHALSKLKKYMDVDKHTLIDEIMEKIKDIIGGDDINSYIYKLEEIKNKIRKALKKDISGTDYEYIVDSYNLVCEKAEKLEVTIVLLLLLHKYPDIKNMTRKEKEKLFEDLKDPLELITSYSYNIFDQQGIVEKAFSIIEDIKAKIPNPWLFGFNLPLGAVIAYETYKLRNISKLLDKLGNLYDLYTSYKNAEDINLIVHICLLKFKYLYEELFDFPE